MALDSTKDKLSLLAKKALKEQSEVKKTDLDPILK